MIDMTLSEILGFVFTNFWTFIGTTMLISAVFNGIAAIFKGIAMMIHGVPESEMKKKISVSADEGDEEKRDF